MSDEAIPAATLILVREPPGAAPELLMVERAGGMAFAAGALVFPGGRIDDADRELAAAAGIDAAAVAAIRETVEETAVPVGLSPLPDPDTARVLQDALVADRPFAELLRRHGLGLDADRLTPFAEWVAAADVLERDRRGAARLIFPTRRTLERLALHRSFEEIRADALAHDIVPVTPWVEERDGERFITIPADLGYPVTEERLESVWRG